MTRKLRILFIVAEPQTSPAISVHANLMRFLDRDRVEVHAIYPRSAVARAGGTSPGSTLRLLSDVPGIGVRSVEFGPAAGAADRRESLVSTARAAIPAARDLAALVRFIRRRRIDVIHCEYGLRNGPYGYLLSRLTPAHYIVHFHAPYGPWLKPPSAFAIKRADAVVPVSRWVGRTVEQAGVPPGRILPVINGIDVSRWDPTTDGTGVRREFEIGPEDPVVVQVAQLVDWKRQGLVIDAFRTVAARHPRAHLLLVGDEQDPGPGYADRLRRQVTDTGLQRQVHFAGRRSDVAAVLAAADVFTLPSVGDPCALAHLEAMAMGLAVVGVQAAGAPELIEHGRTGLLGPPDDAAVLSENLLALIEDPTRRIEMGRHGRRRVLESFNAQRMADDMEAVYRRLCVGPAL